MKRTLRSIILFLLLLIPAIGLGQQQLQQIISSNRGLSSTLIGDIEQDRNGNLWIATENGLNRYNGITLASYYQDDNNQHSLASNYVRTLLMDRDGNIFVGTRAGIQLYDPKTDEFSLPATFADGEPSFNIVNHIIQRKNGEIISSGNLLTKVTIKDGNPILERIDAGEFSTVVEAVFEDSKERLWISKEGVGVLRINPDGTQNFYKPIDPSLYPFILCFSEDAKGNIIAGSILNGFLIFDEEKHNFIPIGEKAIVRDIMPLNETESLICTDGKGLKVFNNETHQISDYPIEVKGIVSEKAKTHAATKDRYGNLWVALFQKGALVISGKKQPFQTIGNESFAHDIIGTCCVTAVDVGANGETFIGTDNDGIYIVNKDKKSSLHLSHEEYKNIPQIVIGLYEDSDRNLWIGSYGDGASIINLKTKTIRKVEGIFESANDKQQVENIYDFVEDNDRRVWIATMGGGLHCYDLNKKKMTAYNEINRIVSQWICSINFAPKSNSLLVGTYDGLWRIGLDNMEKDIRQILNTCIIHDVCEDCDGIVWAATSDGLARWDIKSDSSDLKMFSLEDGFPSNICYSLEQDDNGMLWIGTGSGLVRLDRQTFSIKKFYAEDGIQSNEFSKNASTCDPTTRELYFAGVNGVTWFNPADVSDTQDKWKVYIADMFLAGKPIRVGMKSGGRDIITEPLPEANDFYFNHNDNSITLELCTDDLSNSDKRFFYSMDGGGWIQLPKGTNQISFSSLPTGTYTFCAKVVDDDIESDVRTIYLHIRPAWWMTWWSVLLFLGVVAYIIYYMLEQIRRRRLMRLKMYHHIQSERNIESKLQFLTNVSHKIRTPMTLILNPLQELIDNDSDNGRQETYQRMKRNADRIMTLVNEFMDVKKFDRTKLESQIVRWHEGHNNSDTEPTRIEQPAGDDENVQKTILIAEDDKEIRSFLVAELSSEYRVVACENGALALDFIMKEVPNIIVSDVMMPEMDGFALVKKIRQNIQFNDIPIILLTAMSMQEDNIKGLELGADAYITKPFDMRILRQNIVSLLKSRQTLKNIYSGNQAQEGKVAEIKTHTPDEILMEKVMRVINENISNTDLSVEKIADEVGVSRMHLHRKLKQLTNQSTRDLIRNQRITLAAKILKEKKIPISEVAYRVGFSSPAHFTTAFKSMYGMSPTQYCQSHSESNSNKEK